ncbi:hypothetical protein HUN08_12450 [Gordonia sp. X0973]|uniref:hypothetical protein n=1 Tax=Gordonia sp. X0973 TaxID=2742602 RepID=UPI000F51C6DF|nr:hypothetical protein [Gordonia sp. X0973]QKT07906.1 hypothetical protein HUN08_12450 [Gordonia sp. X0973]
MANLNEVVEAPLVEIQTLFEKAAWSVKNEGWTRLDVEEIIQELYVWYFENDTARRKLAGWEKWPNVYTYLKVTARRICGKDIQDDRKFRADYDYSIDVVKQVLKREVHGPKAVDDFLDGMGRLHDRHWDYWDILRRRYENDERMGSKKSQNLLYNAHIALTDEMNNASRERREEWSDEPGKTLGDGLGRPNPQPPPMEVEQQEPEPSRGYYERRKYDAD